MSYFLLFLKEAFDINIVSDTHWQHIKMMAFSFRENFDCSLTLRNQTQFLPIKALEVPRAQCSAGSARTDHTLTSVLQAPRACGWPFRLLEKLVKVDTFPVSENGLPCVPTSRSELQVRVLTCDNVSSRRLLTRCWRDEETFVGGDDI